MDEAPPSAQSERPPRPTDKGHYYKFNEDTNNWEDIGWLKYCFMRHNAWWDADHNQWEEQKNTTWSPEDYHRLKTLHWVEKIKVRIMKNLVDKKKKELNFVNQKGEVKTDSELSPDELDQLDQLLAVHNHIENIDKEKTRKRLAELHARFQILDGYLEKQKPFHQAAAKARQDAAKARQYAFKGERDPDEGLEEMNKAMRKLRKKQRELETKRSKMSKEELEKENYDNDFVLKKLPTAAARSSKATASRLAALRKKLAA